jgi:glycoside/pentoside/hexuronide:cation symporter, GPH family
MDKQNLARSLSNRLKLIYAFGMLGWSILINIIGVVLVYFYMPPSGSGLPNLMSNVAIFGAINAMALITSSSRLADALFDPIIANYSDKSNHPRGRRIPIMKFSILPSLLFCILLFYPLYLFESQANILWLGVCLIGFYISTTSFIIPYNALLPEITNNSEEQINLATWQSVGYVIGIAISSTTFNLSHLFESYLLKTQSIQLAIFIIAGIGALCLIACSFGIDEKKYCQSKPSTVKLKVALVHTLKNKNFVLFLVADFAYFISITIITSGLLYLVTVLLKLQETIGNKLMISLVLISFIFYPITNTLSKRLGKKKLVILSLLILAMVFLGVYFLGKLPFSAEIQIFGLIGVAAIPMASLNILPNAILAEIIKIDSSVNGNNNEAVYFAVRYFFVKIAQTLGIGVFSMLLIYGNNSENDFGIRLNGIVGFLLCLMAAIIFTGFKEKTKANIIN